MGLGKAYIARRHPATARFWRLAAAGRVLPPADGFRSGA